MKSGIQVQRMSFISQVSVPSSTALAAIGTALIAGGVAIAKKLLPRKEGPKPDVITRAEFHQGMDSVRDRVGASYLALSDKMDAQQRSVLEALERQGARFERRLDQLESAFARLDERTLN